MGRWQPVPKACSLLGGVTLTATVLLTSAQPSPIFQLITSLPPGACEISGNGTCISDGLGEYGNGERCTYRVLQDSVLTVFEFNTEAVFDTLAVNSTIYGGRVRSDDTVDDLADIDDDYYGSLIPGLFGVTSGTVITWASDSTLTLSGYMLCGVPGTAPPTVAPTFAPFTPPPTVAPTRALPMALPSNRGAAADFEVGRLFCNSPPLVNTTLGASIVLNGSSPEQIYVFVAHREETVTFSTCGSSFDTLLVVKNYTGRGYGTATAELLRDAAPIVRVDDVVPAVCGSNRLLAQATVRLGPGFYAVIVQGAGLAAGPYALSAQCSVELRGEVSVDAAVEGNTQTGRNVIGNDAPDHFYTFLVSSPGEFTFDLCNSTYDTFIRLYTFDMVEFDALDDGGCSATNGQVRLTSAMPIGEYIVVVEGYDIDEGQYQLRVSSATVTAGAVYQGDLTCDSAVRVQMLPGEFRQFNFAVESPGTFRVFGCLPIEHSNSNVTFELYPSRVSGDVAPPVNTQIYSTAIPDCRPYFARLLLAIDVTIAENFTLVVNTSAAAVAAPVAVDGFHVECPEEFIGRLLCPPSHMGLDVLQFARYYDNTSVYGDTRYGVDGRQSFALQLHASVLLEVNPCTQGNVNAVLHCCAATYRVIGTATFANFSLLNSSPQPSWQSFCDHNGVAINRTLRVDPGLWTIEVYNPLGNNTNGTSGHFSFSYDCADPMNQPQLQCNGTSSPMATNGLEIQWFRAPVSGVYQINVCGGNGTTHVVIHTAGVAPLTCSGVQCCNANFTALALQEGDEMFVEIDNGSGAHVVLTCPAFTSWRGVGQDGTQAVQHLQPTNYWATLCESMTDWSNEDANVACQMIGFTGGISTSILRTNLGFDVSTTDTIGGTNCTGTETNLFSCGLNALSQPSRCDLTFPAVRCFTEAVVDDIRQLQCGQVIQQIDAPRNVFGRRGGDVVAVFNLTETATIVLSTCESEAATDLYLWSLGPQNDMSTVDLRAVGPLLHSCDSSFCSIQNSGCGLKASLGGDQVPLELPAGAYLVVTEFQDDQVGQQVLSLSMSCSAPLTSNSLRIDGAAASATTAQGFVDVWNTSTRSWQRLRDDLWTKQDAQVVCRQFGFAFGDNPQPPQSLDTLESRQCSGLEPNLASCPLRASSGVQPQSAYVDCAERQSLSVANRADLTSQSWWLSLPPTLFVGQSYATLAVNLSIFEGISSIRNLSPLSFSLEVLDGPRYVQTPGQFLVNQRTGELLAEPRRSGLVGLVLSARDEGGFSTIVFSREISVRDREFLVNSSWRPSVLSWPNRVTVNSTITLDGPAEVGWTNDLLFVGHNDVRFAISGENRGRTFIDTRTGSFTLTASITGTYQLQLVAVAVNGNADISFVSPVVVKNHSFSIRNPDTATAAFGPNGMSCANGGTAVDTIPLDDSFTCRCNLLEWQGPNCEVAVQPAASSTSSSSNRANYYAAFALFVLAVLCFLLVKYYRKSYAAKKRRALINYIKVLSSDRENIDDQDFELAVHNARAPVLREVVKFSPHVAERAQRISIAMVTSASRIARRKLHRWVSQRRNGRDVQAVETFADSHALECNGALFIALALERQDLIPQLVHAGADASLKHPETGKLAISHLITDRLLVEEDDELDIVPIRFSALDALLRAGGLNFDDALGQLLRRNTVFIQLVDDEGLPVVLDLDGHDHDIGTLATTSSRGRTLWPKRIGSDPSNAAVMAEYANRELEGYTTVRRAVRSLLITMAKDEWRSRDERRDTVIHRVLVACQLGRLSEGIAMDLMNAVLDAVPSLLLQENARGISPGKIAMQCQGSPAIERTFTIVAYKHFQLINPARPRYKSDTALIHEVRDLRIPEDQDHERLVIKLMQDEDSWARELKIRDAAGASSSGVIAITGAATLQEHVDFLCSVPVECCPGLNGDVKLQATAELLESFPYALVMPMAERNLAEVIQSERLAHESMDVIRQVGFRIASAIHGLHLAGVVHGDIKPRNIVRSQGNEFRVIDLDMSFSVRLPAEGQDRSKTVSYDLASPKRIRNSSAYCCPELFRQVTSSEQNGLASIQEVLQSPYRIDVWSFGVTLFEIATGLALFECQYDRVTTSGEARLLGWQGLNEAHVAAIEELYKSSESAALIDLLKWLLDPVAVQRPPDMAGVLAHLFFNPKHGAMREHAAVDHIRALLADRNSGPRTGKRVFLSYCWADSDFVLNHLAPALAAVVDELWLDRLGGDSGMGEWTRASMEKGVSGSEIVVAVVSPSYVKSRNCGFEMGLCHTYKKTMIPLKINIPFSSWPPQKIGDTEMIDQFRSATGDMRLYVDFSDKEAFSLKFNTELLPRITRSDQKQDVRPNPGKHLRQPATLESAVVENGASVTADSKSSVVLNPTFQGSDSNSPSETHVDVSDGAQEVEQPPSDESQPVDLMSMSEI